MVTAEGSDVGQHIEGRRIADVRSTADVVTGEAIGRRLAAGDGAAPTVSFVAGPLERPPVRRSVIAVAGHASVACHLCRQGGGLVTYEARLILATLSMGRVDHAEIYMCP